MNAAKAWDDSVFNPGRPANGAWNAFANQPKARPPAFDSTSSTDVSPPSYQTPVFTGFQLK
ncbi:hypothetical protein HNO88_004303 [Novosphingobium chloroacetimidivorans]|uniref:Uncharacterized protein n=1 Tax=Novosphingobium chloroacetimidivorans TaxID=1428314 RepID=A0A7W7KDQ8_9SPHN|nr:hypothetical protein [Novosphingobium chloroacetimidivorans]